MKRILVLFALLAASGAQAAVKADPAQGQVIAQQMCVSCHGADGNSVAPANPRLAAQPAAYLYKQLQDFKSKARINPTMNSMAAGLTEADMRNVAAYYAAQTAKDGKATDVKLAEQGRKLYHGGRQSTGLPACMGCHAPTGAGIPAQFPRLAGQHAAYVEAQLKAYRAGERANDEPYKGAMRAIAAKLSDADIKALAEYIAGLKSAIKPASK